MRLPETLRRLFSLRRREGTDRSRYSEAEDLEKRTQAHYRRVTGSDEKGRPDRKG